MTDTPNASWHVELDGARHGPLLTSEIQQMLLDHKLSHSTLVWQSGFTDWQPLATTSLATLLPDEPPPLSGRAVPNGLVWTLAFAPLIGAFLEELCAQFFIPSYRRTRHSADSFWWVTLALNVVLSVLDEKKLQRAGHDTSRMGAAWIVPVYLYKRATALKQNLAYFFVWIALFVVLLFA